MSQPDSQGTLEDFSGTLPRPTLGHSVSMLNANGYAAWLPRVMRRHRIARSGPLLSRFVMAMS
jgi:hypothetical protein